MTQQRFQLSARKKADFYLQWLEDNLGDQKIRAEYLWIDQSQVVLAQGSLSGEFALGGRHRPDVLAQWMGSFDLPISVSLEMQSVYELAKKWDDVCKLEYVWDCQEGGDGIHEVLENWDIEAICICGWMYESGKECSKYILDAISNTGQKIPCIEIFHNGHLWWPHPSKPTFVGEEMTLHDVIGYGETCTYTMMGRDFDGDGQYVATQSHWSPLAM